MDSGYEEKQVPRFTDAERPLFPDIRRVNLGPAATTPWSTAPVPLQSITRKGSFDSGHRVMHERMKCFNMHGHTYLYELTFGFCESRNIGYPMDFKEIKRLACQWIDDVLDHAWIANPHDEVTIKAAQDTKSKLYMMSIEGDGAFCNPTVENIAKELFCAIATMFAQQRDFKDHGLMLSEIRLWETPNCSTLCTRVSVTTEQYENWFKVHGKGVLEYCRAKGSLDYDDRQIH